jgi:hypothetical protein
MDVKTVGEAGLTGWRQAVADRAAPAVARRTPLRQDQVRALIGGAFLALAVAYIARAALQLRRRA